MVTRLALLGQIVRSRAQRLVSFVRKVKKNSKVGDGQTEESIPSIERDFDTCPRLSKSDDEALQQ